MNLSNKKVLVTGAGGFIGSHLVEELVRLGANVLAFVHYNSFNRWGWLETLDREIIREIEIYVGDVRDYDSVKKAVKGKDVVFHLAALISIPYSYQTPMAFYKTNVEGTLNVLEACMENDVQKLIHTSTSEVYGTALYIPIDENHPLQAQSPYSASKIAADKAVESFVNSYDLNATIVRPFNTYGPRQSARAIIPTVITQILGGVKNIRVGNIQTIRDFNYVKDTVRGFIKAAEYDGGKGEVYNIGSGKEISIKNLIHLISEVIGVEVEVVVDEKRIRPDKSEVMRLCCDNSKAKIKLGWYPQYDLKAGLIETVNWFRDNYNLYKWEIYNI
ncbi:SDR family NAD(P)-dependent oxidoreductase [Caldicellulosiruptor changbaiensis]|uniref:SDR family NAD(P)-dependent oxidoreductase n=1 Tax=Caldicellulosiruptor changbaiensis TaxID=1222016 RepID=A0A3T0D697_9FIRM|nr:SDR family NAD(P)-dependent oxidoreductase [Caldicellulosiruptor changbaiensis]AZT90574.1 SDR family NAD(P)-dependent oxidoreductase [Caldicellulosiruptor changbaiensis]